ncbi:hypothetical protein NE237_020934 [Protea cynaroides]|uniref:Uncharacterized protein n=1 Tax=Protea cynaroides TaxID=273540 RepID=A0A9Q0K249_9MAGN|nr:hypothetical protein NE237_020934 [Protea cynaroides]
MSNFKSSLEKLCCMSRRNATVNSPRQPRMASLPEMRNLKCWLKKLCFMARRNAKVGSASFEDDQNIGNSAGAASFHNDQKIGNSADSASFQDDRKIGNSAGSGSFQDDRKIENSASFQDDQKIGYSAGSASFQDDQSKISIIYDADGRISSPELRKVLRIVKYADAAILQELMKKLDKDDGFPDFNCPISRFDLPRKVG